MRCTQRKIFYGNTSRQTQITVGSIYEKSLAQLYSIVFWLKQKKWRTKQESVLSPPTVYFFYVWRRGLLLVPKREINRPTTSLPQEPIIWERGSVFLQRIFVSVFTVSPFYLKLKLELHVFFWHFRNTHTHTLAHTSVPQMFIVPNKIHTSVYKIYVWLL